MWQTADVKTRATHDAYKAVVELHRVPVTDTQRNKQLREATVVKNEDEIMFPERLNGMSALTDFMEEYNERPDVLVIEK